MKKMWFLKIIITTTAATLIFANPVHAQQLSAGLWKVKTIFKLNGIALPTTEDEDCISATEAKDVKGTVTKELKRNDCEIKSWKVSGKNLEATIACSRAEIEAEGNLKGQFTKKSYQLSGDATGTFQGVIPSTATLQLSGSWVKACTPATK